MSTPSDVLHAALRARPLQTASELTLTVAASGQGPVTTAEIEQLLAGDPRLRHDSSVPPRWRALGTGQPATVSNVPTPRGPFPQVVPAAGFGERAGSAVASHPAAPAVILPAAAFAGRPSMRLTENAPAAPAPGRVPVFPRVAAEPAPPVAAPIAWNYTPTVTPTPAAAEAARPTVAPIPAQTAGPTVAPTPAQTPTVARTDHQAPTPTIAPTYRPAVESTPARAVTATVGPAAVQAPTVAPTAHQAPTRTVAPTAHQAPTRTVAPTPAAPTGERTAETVPPSGAPTSSSRDTRTSQSAAAPSPTPTVARTDATTIPRTEVPTVAHTDTRPSSLPTTAPAPPPAAQITHTPPVRVVPEDRAPAEPAVTAPAPAHELFLMVPTPPVPERAPLPPGGDLRYVGPPLRRWQKDVLDAWLTDERRGIVEAVSAEGRRMVGVLAAWDALTRGEKVLVLVPTTDLLDQWCTTLELDLPGLSIGRRDLTTAHTFDECDVLVSLVSAAFGHELLAEGMSGLLVADEVHRYGSARPAEALRDGFGARLGLTSSMERQDAGFDEVLRPYFGAVLDGCDLRRGRQDGVLAPFRLAFVPVDLGADEQAEHDALSAQIRELRRRLAAQGCARGTFVDDVVRLQGSWRENARGAADASAYLRAVSTRRDLLATSSAKVAALAMLAPMLARSTRALVFTHTKDGADAAAKALCGAGVPTAWWHNGLEPAVRRTIVRDLRAGQLTAIAAPKVLDEGLDLPAVDAVVVLAASRSFRQLVQRVSPILAPTEPDRLPVVVVVHARGTVDADDGHVEELAAVATEVRSFDDGLSGAAVAAWFLGS